ncbi:MAG: hypothetical protein ACFCVD_10120 [Nodosilinea sp.]
MKPFIQVFQLAAVVVLILPPTVAQANSSPKSAQTVSESTVVTGNGAVTTRQTSQSVLSTAAGAHPHRQVVVQGAGANPVAVGNQSTAATQLNQVITQTLREAGLEAWVDEYTQMVLHQAGVGTPAH